MLCSIVPTPNVLVTALNNQQVGDPLLLECNVTTVRGITSSVDIEWSANGTEVGGARDVPGEAVGNTMVYRNVFNGSRLILSKEHDGVSCECHLGEPKAISVNHVFKLSKLFLIISRWDCKN